MIVLGGGGSFANIYLHGLWGKLVNSWLCEVFFQSRIWKRVRTMKVWPWGVPGLWVIYILGWRLIPMFRFHVGCHIPNCICTAMFDDHLIGWRRVALIDEGTPLVRVFALSTEAREGTNGDDFWGGKELICQPETMNFSWTNMIQFSLKSGMFPPHNSCV